MYFFICIILLLCVVPVKNKVINYFKLFICSFICFYYLEVNSMSLISLIISLLSFINIVYLLYQILKIEIISNDDNNIVFNLAHEVKNPLAVCKGYLSMIDTNDKDKLERYLPIIKNEIDRSLNIMDDFLKLKKISLNKDLMDLSILINDVRETTNILLKNNNVNINMPDIDKELIIDGDYDKLKQVFINLIKNAYEADAKNITIDIKKNSNYLKIKIIDDGCGISKMDLKKIGNVFYTTKVAGTGIGVSLSKEIVKLHDGELSYDSVINKGTTATMILPFKYIF